MSLIPMDLLSKLFLAMEGLSPSQFADKLGMTTVGLAQILAGKPSYTTLEKIASALDVEVWELLVSREEVIGKQEPHSPTIICPNCGKEITIKVE